MPKRERKTVDVSLPLPKATAVKWLRARAIPFTHMRQLTSGATAFRIRRGYYGDFRHQKDISAPRYAIQPGPGSGVPGSNSRRRTRRAPRRASAYRKNRTTYNTLVDNLRVRWFQGYPDDIRYTRESDGQKYSHVVETDAAELYLCSHPDYGNCLLIVDPSGKTPLWK